MDAVALDVAKPADLAACLTERVQSVVALLQRAERDLAPAVLAFSGGAEDMVLFDLVARYTPSIDVFMLDTGRLHAQTHALVAAAEARYRRRIAVFVPDAAEIEAWVRLNGINGFYDSVAQRQGCCTVRKVAPLARALEGKRAWITGQRKDQSVTRSALVDEAWDAFHSLVKLNPLAEWSNADVGSYLDAHHVPVNVLHMQGYPSIGCAPCTRAIQPGEHPRAGRWWWEEAESKECGLHSIHRVAIVADP